MSDKSAEILSAIYEIRDLIRLMAEPAIAKRDQKLRDELRRIVGRSAAKAKSVLVMDGTRTQRAIIDQTDINGGDLSTLVKRLKQGELISEDAKHPKLLISVPSNFFEKDGEVHDA